MSNGARRRASYEDLEAVPPNKVGEIVHGELHVSPRPASAHAHALTALAASLFWPFREGVGGPGGWVILLEPEVHLSGDALVPDLAGWRRERMPELPLVPALTTAPDWVCEVLSPSTEALDRGEKMEVYAQEGVRHLWLVEPLRRVLEVYRLEGRRYSRQGSWSAAASVRAEPFEALALRLEVLWRR